MCIFIPVLSDIDFHTVFVTVLEQKIHFVFKLFTFVDTICFRFNFDRKFNFANT